MAETQKNIDDEVDKYELHELDKLSFDENKWCKHAFENKLKNIYVLKGLNILIVMEVYDDQKIYSVNNNNSMVTA